VLSSISLVNMMRPSEVTSLWIAWELTKRHRGRPEPGRNKAFGHSLRHSPRFSIRWETPLSGHSTLSRIVLRQGQVEVAGVSFLSTHLRMFYPRVDVLFGGSNTP